LSDFSYIFSQFNHVALSANLGWLCPASSFAVNEAVAGPIDGNPNNTVNTNVTKPVDAMSIPEEKGVYERLGVGNVVAVHLLPVPGTDLFFFMERYGMYGIPRNVVCRANPFFVMRRYGMRRSVVLCSRYGMYGIRSGLHAAVLY
jgi:hypothetical protein